MSPYLRYSPHWLVTLVISVCAIPSKSQADDWARFRGPNGTGQSAVTGLPLKWTESDYRWKKKLAGSGSSAPVIWGNRLFVTSCNTETAGNFCSMPGCNKRKTALGNPFPIQALSDSPPQQLCIEYTRRRWGPRVRDLCQPATYVPGGTGPSRQGSLATWTLGAGFPCTGLEHPR